MSRISRTPRSTREICTTARPVWPAKSSWVQPRAKRAERTLSPNRRRAESTPRIVSALNQSDQNQTGNLPPGRSSYGRTR